MNLEECVESIRNDLMAVYIHSANKKSRAEQYLQGLEGFEEKLYAIAEYDFENPPKESLSDILTLLLNIQSFLQKSEKTFAVIIAYVLISTTTPKNLEWLDQRSPRFLDVFRYAVISQGLAEKIVEICRSESPGILLIHLSKSCRLFEDAVKK